MFLLSTTISGYAQVTKSRSSAKFKKIKVGHSKAIIICPTTKAKNHLYPFHALGIKFGDPLAVSYKVYLSKNYSLAVDIGKSASGLYGGHIREIFKNFIPDTLKTGQRFSYLTHKVKSDLFAEIKGMRQFPTPVIAKGLQVYVGLGLQLRNISIRYNYSFEDAFNAENSGKIADFKGSKLTTGLTAVAGLEYSYAGLPISAFIEIEYFQDVSSVPRSNRFQGGIGLRYIF